MTACASYCVPKYVLAIFLLLQNTLHHMNYIYL